MLIYMMDPVPHQRVDSDIRAAEAYVVGFLNQHQAAKNVMYHWLGRIYPGAVNQTYDSAFVEANMGTFNYDANVIAMPNSTLVDALPDGMSVEAYNAETGHDITMTGYLKPNAGNGATGSYFSALICLDADKQLTPCYQYGCTQNNGMDEINGSGMYESCNSVDAVTFATFRNGVRPYIITYSQGNEINWWGDKGMPRALRLQKWRQAMQRRTHGSFNCGVLLGGGWHQEWEEGLNRYRSESDANKTSAEYCMDNGYRCMGLLPDAVANFLKDVLTGHLNRQDTNNANSPEILDEIFVCMSQFKSPHDPLPQYHFDGVNSGAIGAPYWLGSIAIQGQKGWYNAHGSVAGGNVVTQANDQDLFVDVNNVGMGKFFALQAMTLPVQDSGQDFTLSFVLYHNKNFKNNTRWLIDGTDAGGQNTAYFSLRYNGGTKNFEWYHMEDSAVGNPWELSMSGLSEGTHAWTIVRRESRLYVFVDGVLLGQPNGQRYFNNSGFGNPPSAKGIVFGDKTGADANSYIGVIRYYNTALNGSQIEKNFLVDVKRFGAAQQEPDMRVTFPIVNNYWD